MSFTYRSTYGVLVFIAPGNRRESVPVTIAESLRVNSCTHHAEWVWCGVVCFVFRVVWATLQRHINLPSRITEAYS